LRENTLVIFTSDNGGNMYDRPEGENPTGNYPLRAGKGNSYEGGVRVPFIASWPGVIAPGTVNDTVTISYDFFPTVLDLLGRSAPDGHPLDGVSLLPALRGEKMDRGAVYIDFPHTVLPPETTPISRCATGRGSCSVSFTWDRTGRDRFELYDLAADPGETRDLSARYPAIVERMRRDMAQHLKRRKPCCRARIPSMTRITSRAVSRWSAAD
jgi:arylsulfatase A-like enzyme